MEVFSLLKIRVAKFHYLQELENSCILKLVQSIKKLNLAFEKLHLRLKK